LATTVAVVSVLTAVASVFELRWADQSVVLVFAESNLACTARNRAFGWKLEPLLAGGVLGDGSAGLGGVDKSPGFGVVDGVVNNGSSVGADAPGASFTDGISIGLGGANGFAGVGSVDEDESVWGSEVLGADSGALVFVLSGVLRISLSLFGRGKSTFGRGTPSPVAPGAFSMSG
jgi:hypothetical protein